VLLTRLLDDVTKEIVEQEKELLELRKDVNAYTEHAAEVEQLAWWLSAAKRRIRW
jgi:hypothetical protein